MNEAAKNALDWALDLCWAKITCYKRTPYAVKRAWHACRLFMHGGRNALTLNSIRNGQVSIFKMLESDSSHPRNDALKVLYVLLEWALTQPTDFLGRVERLINNQYKHPLLKGAVLDDSLDYALDSLCKALRLSVLQAQ